MKQVPETFTPLGFLVNFAGIDWVTVGLFYSCWSQRFLAESKLMPVTWHTLHYQLGSSANKFYSVLHIWQHMECSSNAFRRSRKRTFFPYIFCGVLLTTKLAFVLSHYLDKCTTTACNSTCTVGKEKQMAPKILLIYNQVTLYLNLENFRCSNIFRWPAGIRKLKAQKFFDNELLKQWDNACI